MTEGEERAVLYERGEMLNQIEALQQANKQLQVQNRAMRDALAKAGGGIGIIKNTHKIMLFNDSQDHRQSPCSD